MSVEEYVGMNLEEEAEEAEEHVLKNMGRTSESIKGVGCHGVGRMMAKCRRT